MVVSMLVIQSLTFLIYYLFWEFSHLIFFVYTMPINSMNPLGFFVCSQSTFNVAFFTMINREKEPFKVLRNCIVWTTERRD